MAASAALLGACTSSQNGLCAVSAGDPAKPISGTATVDTRDGVLRWQAFPRPVDESVFGANMSTRITNVRYDLKYWKVGEGSPLSPTVVTGLTQPQYAFAGVHEGDHYRWAARATFMLDGKSRCTQWTSIGPPVMWEGEGIHPEFWGGKR